MVFVCSLNVHRNGVFKHYLTKVTVSAEWQPDAQVTPFQYGRVASLPVAVWT